MFFKNFCNFFPIFLQNRAVARIGYVKKRQNMQLTAEKMRLRVKK